MSETPRMRTDSELADTSVRARSQLRHELRTPLNHIIGYSEMLLEELEEMGGCSDLAFSGDLRHIRAAGQQLLETIAGVLSSETAEPNLSDPKVRGPVGDILTRSEHLAERAIVIGQESWERDLRRIVQSTRRLDELLSSVNASLLVTTPSGRQSIDQTSSASDLGIPPDARGGLVLVVDDDESNLDMLSRRLRREGHFVITADAGPQALDLLPRFPFDLVLLDIMMPDMDGFAVLQRLKSDPALRHLPVIMLSALDETESAVRCIEVGADDYLSKPVNAVLLRARIGACLEKKRLRDREQDLYTRLSDAQEKSERLLLNVLPEPIADRLKRGEATIADSFPDVTVMFADLVDFTRVVASISPSELVELLREVFSTFDAQAAQYKLEKIKTIGDSYMVVGGVPVSRPDHAEAIAEMALDMQSAIGRIRTTLGTALALRVGIHTGPVVAGVIGSRKFSYDLWGDTVNIASRMESQGLPGRVQISKDTHARLGNRYRLEKRGSIDLKGRGTIETYWLLGRAE